MKKSTYVLGINYSMHQSAAVIIRDGVVVAGVEEERFTRIKYDGSFPARAIEYCLKEAGIGMEEVQYAGFYWQPWKGLWRRGWWLLRYFPRSLSMLKGSPGRGSVSVLIEHLLVKRRLRALGFRGTFYYVDHHIAHAASAFYVSPHKRAAILTTDFTGEHCTTLLGIGDGATMKVLKRSYLPHSLGLFYAALTQYLGYTINADEYRVMGLAPYGTPKYMKEFSSMIRSEDGKIRADNSWFSFHLGGERVYSDKWISTFGPPCGGEDEVSEGEYKHFAASGQKVLESVLLDLARWLKEKTGEANLVMAGGVALNSSANGVLRAKKIFTDVWVQPAAYDPGCSLGVCFYIWHHLLGNPRSYVMEHAYWGPAYSEEEMRAAAERHGLSCEKPEALEKQVAALLSEGNVIGWYQGRMEWGPRSLGNRSILADPRREEMKDVVNRKIKFREPYRPFAPAVLEEDSSSYFEFDGPSPYMLFVCGVRKEKSSKIPAVVHVDGSARVQTVSKKTNPRFWNLVREFKEKTGESVVLNTSFNVKGEPIVCTPDEAVKCFLNTEMDYLVLGPYLCTRRLRK